MAAVLESGWAETLALMRYGESTARTVWICARLQAIGGRSKPNIVVSKHKRNEFVGGRGRSRCRGDRRWQRDPLIMRIPNGPQQGIGMDVEHGVWWRASVPPCSQPILGGERGGELARMQDKTGQAIAHLRKHPKHFAADTPVPEVPQQARAPHAVVRLF
jgi:hypothetical protein